MELMNELPESDRTRCEIWTRVMGYHRPVSQWNRGKQAEHRDRCPFLLPADLADSDEATSSRCGVSS